MERGLRPDKLDVLPSAPEASRVFKHWLFIFSRYRASFSEASDDQLLGLLANALSAENFELISQETKFSDAMRILEENFIQPPNEVVARHTLATRTQNAAESIDEYVRCLQRLGQDCNFRNVTTEVYRDEYIRDSFINGLFSNQIRTRLLENRTLTLSAAVDQARALELAHRDSRAYHDVSQARDGAMAAELSRPLETPEDPEPDLYAASTQRKWTCFFCGDTVRHDRLRCPARNKTCRSCLKTGHYSKVCKSTKRPNSSGSYVSASSSALISAPSHISLASVPNKLEKSIIKIYIQGTCFGALVDTGSSENFISRDVVSELNLPIRKHTSTIAMASSSLKSSVDGICLLTFCIDDRTYKDVRFLVLPGCCSSFILGLPFLERHSSVKLKYNGTCPPLEVCSLAALVVNPPRIFENLSTPCRPILTKSRKFKSTDLTFIRSEIQRLLAEGIIEPSTSPWRAQVHVVQNRFKRRLVVDYSRTINQYTYLDAFPLPCIEELVNTISHYKIFSTIDLRSAYHCIPLHPDDMPYTAFEADGRLFQFRRLSFGLTNGVACFQRIIDDFIRKNDLQGTFCYLDDVTICGRNQEEHDRNLKRFMNAAEKYKMTLNKSKCKFSSNTICILGYQIQQGQLRPDPSRLAPLREMPIPTCKRSLARLVGLFAYYSRWIPRFSKRIRPLINASFPLTRDALEAIQDLKDSISGAVRASIDEKLPFSVETDASESAIGATLNQDGRPVAFFSRTLNPAERRHCSVEKEAYAIVESVKRWRHYLMGRHFSLITDQRSVSYMFDIKHRGKIKNEKIERWRLELMPFSYNVIHRPGTFNAAADALSREYCAASPQVDLQRLHISLCHPGVSRLAHFVRTRNLPYSMDEIRQIVSSCSTCRRLKPRFLRPNNARLIHSIRPFDRISIDFKGPLPSSSRNKYLFIVVDEYSRFPFAFPCSDISSTTVINCLSTLFSMCGLPGYVHSDRGTSFMSSQVKSFLHEMGVPTSRSTPYHPTGNAQCERYVGIIWRTINLSLASRGLQINSWELVLQDALHSIRSLLCTSTNCTPHERFFSFPRRSVTGSTVPTWLSSPCRVLLRRHVRNKNDPLVDEVDLVEANPLYAHVRFPSGREDTVSIQDLAPIGDTPAAPNIESSDKFSSDVPVSSEPVVKKIDSTSEKLTNDSGGFESEVPSGGISPLLCKQSSPPSPTRLRRSLRVRRSPDRLTYN